MAKSTPSLPLAESVATQTTTKDHPFRMPYGPRYRVPISFTGPGRTKQSFRDECDVNILMRRYASTGVLPLSRDPTQAQYLDVTGADYFDAQLLIAGARSQFFSLPARIRDRFDNDPGEFLTFMEDKRNHEEARELGLLPPLEEEATPPATPPASAAPAPSSQGATPPAAPAPKA